MGRQVLEGGDLPQRTGLREGGRRRRFGVSRLALSSEDPEAISLIPEVLGDDWEVYWSAGKRFGQALKANLPAFDAGKAAVDLAAHSKPQSSLRWPGESPRLQAQPPGELGEAEAGPSEATRQLAALNVSSQSIVNLLVRLRRSRLHRVHHLAQLVPRRRQAGVRAAGALPTRRLHGRVGLGLNHELSLVLADPAEGGRSVVIKMSKQKRKKKQPTKGGMGERHAATTQGF